MRASNTQLPTEHELVHISSNESQREAIRFDFLDNNPDIFAAYHNLAEQADADSNWINNYKTESLEHVVHKAHETTDKLSDFILRGLTHPDINDKLFDSLAIGGQPKSADAIFVFGSPADMRIAKGIELYKSGIAPTLVVSGHGPHYKTFNQSEAERMARFATDSGIPDEAILIESKSITLPDNVKRTLDMFEEINFRPNSICIIATTYILRRAYMEWYKFTPWDIDIIPVSAEAKAPELQRSSWFKYERGVRMLLNEYAKMVIEHKMDLVRQN